MTTQKSQLTHTNNLDTDEIAARVERDSPWLIEATRCAWRRLSTKIMEMYPENRLAGLRCDYVPRTFVEFLHLTIQMLQSHEKAHRRHVVIREIEQSHSRSFQDFEKRFQNPQMGIEYGGISVAGFEESLEENLDRYPDHPFRSPVLGELTIFTTYQPSWTHPWRAVVDWPCQQEISWEGDQRIATENGRYGRFPALPRQSWRHYGSHIPFAQRAYVKPWPLDDVWPVPSGMDVYLEREDEVEPHAVPFLLNQDLLDALDEDCVSASSRSIVEMLNLSSSDFLSSSQDCTNT